MNPLFLLAMIIIPLILSNYIHNKCKKYLLWGIVIAPVSTGLYSLFFIKYIGIIFLIFMPFSLLFNKPAWWLLVEKLSLINGNNLNLYNELILLLVNGLIWGIIFYLIACSIKNIAILKIKRD